jgi:hypothetical protein
MHTYSKSGKNLAFAVAATLLVTFFCGEANAASLPSHASLEAGSVPVKKEARAKVAVKKQKRGVNKANAAEEGRKAPPQPTVAAESTPAARVEASAAPALKPGQAGADDLPKTVPAPGSESTAQGNPYLVNLPHIEAVSAPVFNDGRVFAGNAFKLALPQIPLFEQAILPKIKTVYPTGEKPLVVLTFKCPTELVGIDTPSTLILHKAVNGGMDLINKSNLLAFNMQQVCQ